MLPPPGSLSEGRVLIVSSSDLHALPARVCGSFSASAISCPRDYSAERLQTIETSSPFVFRQDHLKIV